MVQVKICGIKTPEALRSACDNGARFTGFVFYPPSPRAISRDQARVLCGMVPTGVRSVGLFVNPDFDLLDHVLGAVPIDMIQLHGTESPNHIAAIKARYPLPVIKAVSVATTEDLTAVPLYEEIADWILLDAKSTSSTPAALPGGNGHVFDWSILQHLAHKKPWMLAGGLHSGNIHAALTFLKQYGLPDAVDVSSGVESQIGEKDPEKIKAFLHAASMAINNHTDHEHNDN